MSFPYPISVRAVWFDRTSNALCWLNTLKLPHQEEVLCSNDPSRVARAIVDMEIRGAPAIGVAAALVLGAYALKIADLPLEEFANKVRSAVEVLLRTRPTAYNLFYALRRLREVVEESVPTATDSYSVAELLVSEALKIYQEDVEANAKIGELGAELVPDNATILTHCNAGALATSAYGTALAVIRIAWYKGKKIRVVATETRPMLQGARLTAYELVKEGIPVTLITDGAAGMLIRKKGVDLAVVGADRITRDGYVVNKIGTYAIALASKRNNLPFYVAAPVSTVDLSRTISDVVIEERDPNEVKYVQGALITLKEVNALNYAFDITDPDLISAIITERGLVTQPIQENLLAVVSPR
ncbi:MAG: S-methyl-5-thioribose-1-phosphate isomerase [Desulfurococcaceae archaeon]